jgi:hypothetical protein
MTADIWKARYLNGELFHKFDKARARCSTVVFEGCSASHLVRNEELQLLHLSEMGGASFATQNM